MRNATHSLLPPPPPTHSGRIRIVTMGLTNSCCEGTWSGFFQSQYPWAQLPLAWYKAHLLSSCAPGEGTWLSLSHLIICDLHGNYAHLVTPPILIFVKISIQNPSILFPTDWRASGTHQSCGWQTVTTCFALQSPPLWESQEQWVLRFTQRHFWVSRSNSALRHSNHECANWSNGKHSKGSPSLLQHDLQFIHLIFKVQFLQLNRRNKQQILASTISFVWPNLCHLGNCKDPSLVNPLLLIGWNCLILQVCFW